MPVPSISGLKIIKPQSIDPVGRLSINPNNMKDVITWFDLPTADFERAMKFYSVVLGTDVKASEEMGQIMALFPMEGKEGVGGCLMPPTKSFKPSDKGTRIYFNLGENLDRALSQVEKNGGTIMKKKYPIGEWGFVATIKDSEGNIVGLHGTKKADANTEVLIPGEA